MDYCQPSVCSRHSVSLNNLLTPKSTTNSNATQLASAYSRHLLWSTEGAGVRFVRLMKGLSGRLA